MRDANRPTRTAVRKPGSWISDNTVTTEYDQPMTVR